MRRPARQFRPWSLELEARRLLATGPAPTHAVSQTIGFVGQLVPQVFMQQDGPATVQLYMLPTNAPPVQVRVTAVPATPAAAEVVGPVDQTVTVLGTSDPSVTAPILPGAPNPGEVDVDLTITPINPSPNLSIAGPLELRIFSSAAALPPQIVSAQGTPQGIVLTFSKPMDPAGASNVNNYVLETTSTKVYSTNDFLSNVAFYATLGIVQMGPGSDEVSHQAVPLKSAQYDPATDTVTLVPARKLSYRAPLTVTQGPVARSTSGRRSLSNLGPRLTDLEGTPINPWTKDPGEFSITVTKPGS